MRTPVRVGCLVLLVLSFGVGCGGRLRSRRVRTEAPLVVDLSPGAGAGRVRSSPLGLDCDLRPGTTYACDRKFPRGTRVMLSAAPDATSYFAGWSGDCKGRGYCIVTVDRARRVLASFQRPGGNYRWGRRMGGRAENVGTAIVASGDGGVWVAGNFQNSIEFSTGRGDGELLARGYSDIFLVKLMNGRPVWAKSFGGTGEDSVLGLVRTESGQLAMAGYFDGHGSFGHVELDSHGQRDAFLMVLDDGETGPTVRMVDQFGGPATDMATTLSVAGDKIYVAGSFGAPATGTGGTQQSFASLPHRGNNDLFVLGYQARAGGEWGLRFARSFGGKEREYVYGMAASEAGVVLAGSFEDTLILDPGGLRGSPGTPAATGAGSGGGNSATTPVAPAAKAGKAGKGKPTAPAAPPPPRGPGKRAVLPDDPVSAGRGDGYVLALTPDGGVRWVNRFGGTGSDATMAVALLGEEVVVAGSFDKTLDLAGQTLTSEGYGVFLARLGPGGTVVTHILAGHQPWRNYLRLATDAAHGVVLAGALTDSISGSGRRDYTFTRYRTDEGKLVVDWSKRARPTSEKEGQVVGYGLFVDEARNIYLVGALSGRIDFLNWGAVIADAAYDVFFAKLDPGGRWQWLTGSNDKGEDIGRAVARLPDGSIVVTGSFKDNIGYRSVPVAGGADAFVTLFSADGGETETRTIGGAGLDVGQGIAASASAVAVVGSFQREARASADGPPLTAVGKTDAFVAWYSPKLEPVAAVGLGGADLDDAGAVVLAPDGSTYVAATLRGSPQLGQVGDAPVTLEVGARSGAVLIKYSPAHKVEWTRVVSADIVVAGGLALLGNEVVMSGSFANKATVQGGQTMESAGGMDVFVARYGAAGELRWATRIGGEDASERSPALALTPAGEVALGVNVEAIYKPPAPGSTKPSPPLPKPRAQLVWLDSKGVQTGGAIPVARTPCSMELHSLSLVGSTVVVAGKAQKLDYKSGERSFCKYDSDAFVSKITSRRRLVWERLYGAEGNDDACGVVRRERQRTREELAEARAAAVRSLELADDEDDEDSEWVARGGISTLVEDTVVVGNFGGSVKFGQDKDYPLVSLDAADVFVVEFDL